MITWVVVGVVGAVLLIWIIAAYNRLQRLSVRADEAWRDIDTLLKQRANLIPNLVETVKGYAAHEREIFERVAEARAASLKARGPREQGQADNQLRETLRTLFAVVENYPELKANENFISLQRSLEDLEEKIARSRRYYNAVVRDLNTAIRVFPSNIVARLFGVREREFYEVEGAEREVPRVSFTG